MSIIQPNADVYIPDGVAFEEALQRTTHLAVGAHQDDLEIMAFDGILKCFEQENMWFTGIVLTNGGGSPRDGDFKDTTDEEMQEIRRQEQKKAADIGKYGALIQLDYPSSVVKNDIQTGPVDDLEAIIELAKPEVVYLHNPADKHETHVASFLRALAAIRNLPRDMRPDEAYGCEVWRDLDWLPDEYKIAFDVSAQPELQIALLEVFESQISGGKRYDLATLGRRRANATYYASHGTDTATSMIYAMDLMPLVKDAGLDIKLYVQGHIERFGEKVEDTLDRLG
ncbi:MAG: PIG-L deacetylase family protein [Candidatus Aminicenantaceae bacterium]